MDCYLFSKLLDPGLRRDDGKAINQSFLKATFQALCPGAGGRQNVGAPPQAPNLYTDASLRPHHSALSLV
jgi:hypothetical protein